MNTMRQQWDEIARINAAYGIVSIPEFEGVDAVVKPEFWASGRRELEGLLDQLDLGDSSAMTLVEIGCGIGRMTHAFAPRFARVIALDVSEEMIRRARACWPGLANVDFRVGSGSDLAGIPDASVDFVFSWFVLQHLPDAALVLHYVRETGRVLKPGGRAFLHMRTSRGSLEAARRAFERWLYYRMPHRVRRAITRGGHLEDEFAARFRVWRGSAVRIADVIRTATDSGLVTVAAEPAGEGFTAFRLRKS